MFKLLLQQMRLQRAIISFLTAKEEVATDKDATFEVVLKDSIIKEKQDLLKILDKHLSHLQDVGAPDAIVVGKKTQMVAVEGGTVELGWAEPREILNSTLGMLNDAILTEYLDLVTDFVGEDSNWPIDSDNSDGEDLVNEMLRS